MEITIDSKNERSSQVVVYMEVSKGNRSYTMARCVSVHACVCVHMCVHVCAICVIKSSTVSQYPSDTVKLSNANLRPDCTAPCTQPSCCFILDWRLTNSAQRSITVTFSCKMINSHVANSYTSTSRCVMRRTFTARD